VQWNFGEISRAIKNLAKELKVPILALAQLNRDVEKRNDEPKPSDLRESGNLEQDADCIMFIHDPPAQEGVEETNLNIREIIIAKNRGGEGNVKLKFAWFGEYTKFKEIDIYAKDENSK